MQMGHTSHPNVCAFLSYDPYPLSTSLGIHHFSLFLLLLFFLSLSLSLSPHAIMAMFVSLIIRLFQLIFSAKQTVFFSHNKISQNSVSACFFSEANSVYISFSRFELQANPTTIP